MTHSAWEPGDIVACWGSGATSRIISVGTASPFGPRELRVGPSHVAIIANYSGYPCWFESTSMCDRPCLIRLQPVDGCQVHTPEGRVNDYLSAGGKVAIYRLTPTDSLSEAESNLLTRILVKHFVRPGLCYDTAGAVLSGTRLLKWSRFAPGADLHSLFCSELIAKMYMRLGRLNRDNPTRFNPASLCRQLVREGTVELVDVMRGDR
jgi:hypothetical protein